MSSLLQTTTDKIKSTFQRFCDGTSLHGYHDLGHAKTPFWRAVWWIMLIFACLITIYQMYYATLQYIDQGSVTSVKSPEEGAILYPPLGICYTHWMYWIDWDKAFRMGFSKESILYGVSFMRKIYNNQTFNVTEAKRNLTEIMVKNKLQTLTQFYTAISRNFPQILGSFPVYPVLQNDSEILRTKGLYYKGETYSMCYTMSGAELANALYKKKIENKYSRSSNTLFNFSLQDLNYNNFKQYITYEEYNYYMAYWLCDQSNYWVVTLEDFAKNYTSFTLPMRLYPDINDEQYIMMKTENEAYDILMTPTVQRLRNTKQQPCNENSKAISTDDACERKCKAKFDNKIYQCMDIDQAALEGIDTTDKLCSNPINFLQYKRENPNFRAYPCNNFVPDGDNDTLRTSSRIFPKNEQHRPSPDEFAKLEAIYYECTNSCDKPCEIWRYAVSVSILSGSATIMAFAPKNQTDVNIFYPDTGDVLIVTNVDAQSWESFVANVGGLLGVWTGASMISFLQVPYLCCLYDTECFTDRKKKKHKSALEKQQTIEKRTVFRKRKKAPPVVLQIDEVIKEKY